MHGKDARIERGLSDINGILEPKPVTESADRVWNYVAVGCGKDQFQMGQIKTMGSLDERSVCALCRPAVYRSAYDRIFTDTVYVRYL